MQKTWVRSLGWADPLEEGMATHSSILARKIPMDRGAWQATVCGVAELDMPEQLSTAQDNKLRLFNLASSQIFEGLLSLGHKEREG